MPLSMASYLPGEIAEFRDGLFNVAHRSAVEASFPFNMVDIVGMKVAKGRIAEAVSARRNVLLVGAQGSGMTMLARRFAWFRRDDLTTVVDVVMFLP